MTNRVKKLIYNVLRTSDNPNFLPFETLQNTVQLTFHILNESRPRGSSFSRAALFWGGVHHYGQSNAYQFFQEERDESKSMNHEDQPLNLAKAAQYEDFLSLWDTKQAANAKQLAQINKSATKTYLKAGDIVMDRLALKSNLSLIHISEPTRPY